MLHVLPETKNKKDKKKKKMSGEGDTHLRTKQSRIMELDETEDSP